jgi:hypothetical protein
MADAESGFNLLRRHLRGGSASAALPDETTVKVFDNRRRPLRPKAVRSLRPDTLQFLAPIMQ